MYVCMYVQALGVNSVDFCYHTIYFIGNLRIDLFLKILRCTNSKNNVFTIRLLII